MSEYLERLTEVVVEDEGLKDEAQSIINDLVEVAMVRLDDGANAASITVAFMIAASMFDDSTDEGKMFWRHCRQLAGTPDPTLN